MRKTLSLLALVGMAACSGSQESREASRGRSEARGAVPALESSPDMALGGAAKTAATAAPASPSQGVLVETSDPRLAVDHRGSSVILSHALAHRHSNPCDFSGEKPELDSLVDFHVELEALPDSLPAAVRKREAGFPVAERFAEGKPVGTEPGFLEEVRIGNRVGYRILLGAEGCGETVFYLPSGPGTLRMARRKVAELDPAAHPDAKSLAGLPGIIPPGEADGLADRILAAARIPQTDAKSIP